jgi:hypothetical protein
MQAMVQDVDGGIAPGHKNPIKPNHTITIIKRGKKVSRHKGSLYFNPKNRESLAACIAFGKNFFVLYFCDCATPFFLDFSMNASILDMFTLGTVAVLAIKSKNLQIS